MKQIIVEIDDETAARLESAAPSRSRKRSAFVRQALQRALDETAERATEQAYREQPDTGDPAYFEPAAWETAAREVPVRTRRSRR
jgi:predicted transcriptional regulator